jgi:hypothetical protein
LLARDKKVAARSRPGDRPVLCPTKSVSAEMIETSLLAQLNDLLSKESRRKERCFPLDGWKEALEANLATLIRATMEVVRYDGASGRVQLDLSPRKLETGKRPDDRRAT